MNYRKNIAALAWIFLLAMVSLGILNLGENSAQTAEKQNQEIGQAEQARQILASLTFAADPRPYLAKIARRLKGRLQNPLLKSLQNRKTDPFKALLSPVFPDHQIWAFSLVRQKNKYTSRPVFYPQATKVSRRGMGNALVALTENQESSTQNKLIDFLFGPGLKVRQLAKRNGQPTRVLYQGSYHFLVWETVVVDAKIIGGFFFLVPDCPELTRFAMTRAAFALTRFDLPEPGKNTASRSLAGYVNLLPGATGQIFPPEGLKEKGIAEAIAAWKNISSLSQLEKRPLPSGKLTGNWRFYAQAIPDSLHLAVVFLQKPDKALKKSGFVSALNYVAAALAIFLASSLFFNLKVPAISLKTRFSLLFLALAAVPFSLLFVAGNLYLEELKVSLNREARQKLLLALSSFDQNVDEVYLSYRNEFSKLHEEAWLHQFLEKQNPVGPELKDKFTAFFRQLRPSLPWGSLIIAEPTGMTDESYRSPEHRRSLEGYMKFNRVGMIEAMRKRKMMPSIALTGKDNFISDEDIALKQAYETQIKLPILHPFANVNVGNTISVSFGDVSVVRLVDYYPNEQNPVFGVSVAWLEKELNREFCISALTRLKKEYSSINFEVFQTNANQLQRIVRTHKFSNLKNIAGAAFMKNGFAAISTNDEIELALPSNRRPGIFLAGSMDTKYIRKKVEQFSSRFLLFLALGAWAVFFFRHLLFKRLILPLLVLEKTLKNAGKGILQPLPPTARRDEYQGIFAAFNQMIVSMGVRRRLLSLVSGAALKLVAKPKSPDSPEDKGGNAVTLVSDIRGFTTLCEQNRPEVITSLLNRHFDRMTRIIHAYGGEIGRFVGDAIEATFYCTGDNEQKTAENAVKAGLLLLETNRIINEERARQGMFPYKIGVGLAFGRAVNFAVGEKTSRTEVLQLGGGLKKAAELEAFTRAIPQCPLLIDKKIALLLQLSQNSVLKPTFADIAGVDGYCFSDCPVVDDLKAHEQVELSPEENAAAEKNCQSAEDKKSEKLIFAGFVNTRPGFLQGLILLMVPVFICLLAILANWQSSCEKIIQAAKEKNQFVLNRAKLSNARQEILSQQFESFFNGISTRIEDCLEAQPGKKAEQNRRQLFQMVEKKVAQAGLKIKQVLLTDFEAETSRQMSLNREYLPELEKILRAGLACYNSQYNRYLQPEDEVLEIFDESISPLVFSRDGRANFVSVSIASASYWLFWQPVVRPYSDWAWMWEKQSSWQLKNYGFFSPTELKTFLLGGILILCEAPQNMADLNCKDQNETALFARLDLKNEKIVEINHEFMQLLNEKIDDSASLQAPLTSFAKALQLAYSDNRHLVVDKNLIQGRNSELHVAVSSIENETAKNHANLQFRLLIMLIVACIVAAIWAGATLELGLAASFAGQIIGSFLGTILIPFSAIILIFSLLYNDWQLNLLEQSKARFYASVEQIENRLSFHHAYHPFLLRKILHQNGISQFYHDKTFSLNEIEFARLEQKLRSMLQTIFTSLFQQRRSFGLNSMMMDFTNGLSEYLLLYGALAEDGDPMKRTFSYQAYRILKRINPEALDKRKSAKDQKQLTLDEITADKVFDTLSSTYGDDACVELLFAQGKSVKLFGGFSVDVFFQEFFPDAANPLGVVFYALSHFHSNQFAMGRILSAWHHDKGKRDPLDFEIFALNRINSGMPIWPEIGAKYPFLREITRQANLAGQLEKSLKFQGKEYQVITYHSKMFPQFNFVGMVKKESFARVIESRLWHLVLLLLLAFLLICSLSFNTSGDIILPLNRLIQAIERVKTGDYSFHVSFDREDELEEIARAFNEMLQKLSEKDLLSRMVSESAMAMASSHQMETVAQRGRLCRAVVIFFGINDFEKFVENSELEKVKNSLQKWFEVLHKIVATRGGDIDKVLEGKVLAVFFVPDDNADAAAEKIRSAIKAASEMVQSQEFPFATSCGVHYGEVISGLMGNQERRDFTVIGDTVNLAARCFSISESARENLGLITTETVLESLSGQYEKTDLGLINIKGKTEPQRLFLLKSSPN